MEYYFAYGSNLNKNQMDNRCPENEKVGMGTLKGYSWIINERGAANIVESMDDEVIGIIYKISDNDEDKLDKYEGVKIGCYKKQNLYVKVNNNIINCLVYIDPITEEGKPREEYIKRINKGIISAKLPENYVKKYIRRYVPED